MMHFKNHNNGFTLVEAMLSMVIIGIVLAPIFILHGTIMQRVNKYSQELRVLLWEEQLLYEARQKQEAEAQTFSLDQKKEEYSAVLKYNLDSGIDAKSSLAVYPGLHREIVSVIWKNQQGIQQQESLITYIYKQPEQKKS
jgi:prepilin-type N-terminal cleavage/methylation domain-containing protein